MLYGRLWYILKNDISDYKIAYTCRLGKNDPIRGNYLELLKLLGIDESKLLMVNQVTQFAEVIIPETSIYPGKYFTKEYKEIFDTIVNNSKVEFSNTRKIYCSRAMVKHKIKREIGEENIEKIFNDNQYESVHLEKMTLKEQIAILNSAQDIACISGTLPHNLLFVRNHAKVTILNKTYKMNMHQFLINQICSSEISFVDVNLSPTPVLYGMGPFIIMVTDCFKDYCKDNQLKCDMSVNYHIDTKTKMWYYITYLLSYRGKIIKETEIDSKEIRKLYKRRQK